MSYRGASLAAALSGFNRTVQGLTLLTEWELTDALQLSTITAYRDYDSLEGVFRPDRGRASIS